MSSATPINSQHIPKAPSVEGVWNNILDALLPDRPIPVSAKSKDGVMEIRRELESDQRGRQVPIWTKKSVRPRQGQPDCSVFNLWEHALITLAINKGLSTSDSNSCLYQLFSSTLAPAPQRSGFTTEKSILGPTSELKTYHAGPDLNCWFSMVPRVNNNKLSNPFCQPANFLRMVKGILTVALRIHKEGFVHCDFRFPNIILPANVEPFPNDDTQYKITPQWDKIKFIDLGYSLHREITPHANLPLGLVMYKSEWEYEKRIPTQGVTATKQLGNRLRTLLETLEKIPKDGHWKAREWYDPTRWRDHATALEKLKTIDWREDLYQFGYWLQRDFLERRDIGELDFESLPPHTREPVQTFIENFPHVLMDWNHGDDMTPEGYPHQGYIQQIDELLASLPKPVEYFTLRREDHDPAYKNYLTNLKNRIAADQRAWNDACQSNTLQAYNHYLASFPQGAFSSQALTKAKVLRREEAATRRKALAKPLLVLGGISAIAFSVNHLVKHPPEALARWKTQPQEAAALPPPTPVATPAPPTAQEKTLAALRRVTQAPFGSATWSTALDELAAVCRTAMQGSAPHGCAGAWNGVQQTYLERSAQAKADPWITQSHYNNPTQPKPSPALQAWLQATAVLARHGIWVAQVNETTATLVAMRQRIQPYAIPTAKRAEAAQQLARLVRAAGAVPSAYGEQPSAATQRQYRIDGAAWLWVVARVGKWGHPESARIAPVDTVLGTVQAVADMPSQNLQNMLAYSLMCWLPKPDTPRALQYLAKAKVPEDTSDAAKKVAQSATERERLIQQGQDLCSPPPPTGAPA